MMGIDIDRSAQDNALLDEFRLICEDSWPIENDSIDLIGYDHVLEHIKTPDQFFSEASRVLRHKGYFCIRTANRWGILGYLQG